MLFCYFKKYLLQRETQLFQRRRESNLDNYVVTKKFKEERRTFKNKQTCIRFYDLFAKRNKKGEA